MGLDQWINVFKTNGDTNQYTYRKVNWLRNWVIENTLLTHSSNTEEVILHIEKLKELLELCKETLEEKQNADEILPTLGGFFFGDTEYDEYYFSSVRKVRDDLNEILENEGAIQMVTYEDWW